MGDTGTDLFKYMRGFFFVLQSLLTLVKLRGISQFINQVPFVFVYLDRADYMHCRHTQVFPNS